MVENRHGLLVDLCVSEANGRSERETALLMMRRQRQHRITVGADRGYDCADLVQRCREANITPHVAQNTHRRSAIDCRTMRPEGYAVSQRIRKRIEQVFGWIKTIGGLRRTRYRGKQRTQLAAYLVGAAYNLIRIAKLAEQSPWSRQSPAADGARHHGSAVGTHSTQKRSGTGSGSGSGTGAGCFISTLLATMPFSRGSSSILPIVWSGPGTFRQLRRAMAS